LYYTIRGYFVLFLTAKKNAKNERGGGAENGGYKANMSYIPDDDLKEIIEMCSVLGNKRKTFIKSAIDLRRDKIYRESSNIKKVLISKKGMCEICGFAFKPILQIHHILPISFYGNNLGDNIICVCPNCHKTLHSLYKMIDKDPGEEYAIEMLKVYDSNVMQNLMDVLNKYILKRGEIRDFFKNSGFEDSSKK